tara:strand:- start:117 stop:359 length:243 start_codon:yes stop_codon:yes gene_type:complete
MENNDQTMNYDPNVLYPPILIEKPEKQQTSIDDVLEINDIRDASDFKGYSFSNYKKTEVKKKINRFYFVAKNRTSMLLVC